MKTILALLLACSATAAPNPQSSRPLLDMRDVVGVVQHGAGIDVYWQHTNEYQTPTRTKLWRTTVSTDGTARLARVLVREFDDGTSPRVDGDAANAQAIWTTIDGAILASPIVNGALKYPDGKLVSEFGMYAQLDCHAAECAVVSTVASQQHATILDADSNAVGTFTLPQGFHPQTFSLSERGLLFVRHHQKEVRTALVRRDGSVQYDVAITDADPLAFHAGPLAIAENGAQDVIAFVDFAPEPDEVHAIAISSDGTRSEPVRLLQGERSPDFPNNISALSLATNGTTYVLTGSYVSGKPFVMRYDNAFRPLDAEPQRTMHIPWASLHADGQRFVMVWSALRPYVTVLSPDGAMTAPVDVDPQPRRRAVR